MGPDLRFAAHSFIWTGSFAKADDIFADAADCGYDGVEIALADLDAVDWNSVGRAKAKHNLHVTLCLTQRPGLSLVHADPSVRAAAVRHVSDAMRRTQDLGNDLLTGPMLNPVGALSGAAPTTAEMDHLSQSLRVLAEAAETQNIRLALEPLNRFQGYLLTRVNDAIDVCRATGSTQVGLLLDLFHMNIEETNASAAIRRAGDLCFHLHVSACDRGVPGTDDFDWDALRDALSAIDYKGWIAVETFCFTEPAAMAKAHLWHRPAMTSKAAAAAAYSHLRRTFGRTPD